MALPPADNNAQKHQQDAKPTRISKIPSRPTSRRGDSERRPTSYSAMTTGSPRSNAISPPPQNTKSPAASSKIPQPPSTPSHHPIPRASRPMSAVQAPRSNLPRALSARETPTVKSPLNLEYTKAYLRFGLNKPLPSPPIAQFVDPNSPPKPQRTLVDAEAGTPSEDQWPIIRPENLSPSETVLTTDEKGLEQQQQQQQQHSASNGPAVVQNTNKRVNNRDVRSFSAFDIRVERTNSPSHGQTLSPSAQDQELLPKPEVRRLSSNNPYAKDFHAVSPKADIAVSSPLAQKSTAHSLLSVPPRVSSKRSSLPSSSQEQTQLPLRAASSRSYEVSSKNTAWPLDEEESDNIQTTTSDDVFTSQSPVTAITSPPHVGSRDSGEHKQEDVQPGTAEPDTPQEDGVVTGESSRPIDVGWTLEASTGWWEKRIITRPDRPGSGPTLRIHQDAEAILFGDPDNMPEDLPDEKPERASVGQSIGALAGRLSRQAMASMVSINNQNTRTPETITISPPKASPGLISPIRAMRPARQTSTALSPKPVSNPAPIALFVQDSHDPNEALAKQDAVEESSADHGVTSPKPAQEKSTRAITAEAYGHKETSPPKARKVMGIQIKSPPRPVRNSGRFMAPTVSSVRKTSGRVSSREPKSRVSTSGSTSASQCRNVHSRLSRIKESIRATRADMTPPHIPPPYSPPDPAVIEAPVEQPRGHGQVEKTAPPRLKAQRSFRKLFSKSEATSTESVATSSEPKLFSIANSGKTLAKRFSKNFSRVHVAEVPENELQNLEALVSVAAASSSATTPESVFLPHEMATTVNGIIASIGTMSSQSLESVRSLEIAESVVLLAEIAKEIQIGQEKARQISRENELREERLGLEKKRLDRLLEFEFKDEGLRGLMARLKGARIVTEH